MKELAYFGRNFNPWERKGIIDLLMKREPPYVPMHDIVFMRFYDRLSWHYDYCEVILRMDERVLLNIDSVIDGYGWAASTEPDKLLINGDMRVRRSVIHCDNKLSLSPDAQRQLLARLEAGGAHIWTDAELANLILRIKGDRDAVIAIRRVSHD